MWEGELVAKMRERREELLNDGAQIEAKKNDMNYVPRVMRVEKLGLLRRKLEKVKEE